MPIIDILAPVFVVIGGVSFAALINGALEPWKAIAASGFGASVAGLISSLLLYYFPEQFIDLFVAAQNALGLNSIIALVLPFVRDYLACVGLFGIPLFTSMVLGGSLSWLLFGRNQTHEETV
jgi:hypothetical protein